FWHFTMRAIVRSFREDASVAQPREVASAALLRRRRQQHHLDAAVLLAAAAAGVRGDGAVLREAGGEEPRSWDLALVLQEAHDVGGARRRQLPVRGEAIVELRRDGHVVGVAAHLDYLIAHLGEGLAHLGEYLLTAVVELSLARVEED